MLLDLTRCLRKYLFCSRKAYAGNAYLVISASTLLKLSIARIPVPRAAWLKVAFASPFKSLSVNVCLNGHVLMLWPSKPWEVCPSRQATLLVILLHNRGGWSHRIRCHYHKGWYDIWSLYIVVFWASFQAAFPGRWSGSPMEIAWKFSCLMIFA